MCIQKNHHLIYFSKDDNIKGNRSRTMWESWNHAFLTCLLKVFRHVKTRYSRFAPHVVAHIGHIIKQAFSILFIKKVMFTWGYNRRKENDRTNYSSLVHGSYCGTLIVHYVAVKHLHLSQAISTKYASVHIICMFHVDFNI
jgi:hypothetical protein